MPDAPPIRGEQVVQIGFMLSRFDSTTGTATSTAAGPFRLRIIKLEPYFS